jgi:F-type H+-transporting ATPase subunit b
MIKKVVWIATVPLALTLLLAEPARGTTDEKHDAEIGANQPGGHGGEHHVVDQPIQNFADFWGYRDVEPGQEKMPPPFLGALTNFAVLMFLVGRFAGPSMARFVRERHDTIAKQIDESTRLREEAQRKLEEYTVKLTGLQAEIERMVSEIRADAENDRRRILAEADARAARMKRDAEQQIQAEMQRVKALLERETVLQAVAIAEKLIRDRAGKVEQRELAERFVKSLESRKESL